jgi:NADH dehydrogenase (ubiquinone) 1 alpha subcomplex subunit 12
MSLKKFGFDKPGILWRQVKQNGGVVATFKKVFRMDDFRSGTLVGEDKYGNKYYENNYYFFPRNRWVEYAKWRNLEYDASQIPADWYGWIHHKTDIPPNKEEGTKVNYQWMADHSENLSGTKNSYYPYSTTKPKIRAWYPEKDEKKDENTEKK